MDSRDLGRYAVEANRRDEVTRKHMHADIYRHDEAGEEPVYFVTVFDEGCAPSPDEPMCMTEDMVRRTIADALDDLHKGMAVRRSIRGMANFLDDVLCAIEEDRAARNACETAS